MPIKWFWSEHRVILISFKCDINYIYIKRQVKSIPFKWNQSSRQMLIMWSNEMRLLSKSKGWHTWKWTYRKENSNSPRICFDISTKNSNINHDQFTGCTLDRFPIFISPNDIRIISIRSYRIHTYWMKWQTYYYCRCYELTARPCWKWNEQTNDCTKWM